MDHIAPPQVALLALINAHIAETGISKSAFGSAAVGDPGFVSGLEAGREPRTQTVVRVREYIATGVTHEAAKAKAS